MQHVWRLTNHNTGGALLKTNKIFSFDLNKITSTWFEETHYKSSLLSLTAVSKKGNKLMLAKYGSDKLLLYQPLTPNSIMNRIFSYSPSRPSDSAFLHYFPSLACPLWNNLISLSGFHCHYAQINLSVEINLTLSYYIIAFGRDTIRFSIPSDCLKLYVALPSL